MMTEQQPQPQPRLQIPCFWKHILEAAEIKHWCQLGGSGLCIYVQRKKLTTPYISRVLQRMFATAKDLKTWSHSKKHLNTCMYVKIIPYLKNLNIPIMFYQWQLISTQKKTAHATHLITHTRQGKKWTTLFTSCPFSPCENLLWSVPSSSDYPPSLATQQFAPIGSPFGVFP